MSSHAHAATVGESATTIASACTPESRVPSPADTRILIGSVDEPFESPAATAAEAPTMYMYPLSAGLVFGAGLVLCADQLVQGPISDAVSGAEVSSPATTTGTARVWRISNSQYTGPTPSTLRSFAPPAASDQPDFGFRAIEEASNGRLAYEASRRMLSRLEDAPEKEWTLVAYLANDANAGRTIALSCMADREYEIQQVGTVRQIAALLRGSDQGLRQSAALALRAGGAEASAVLTRELGMQGADDIAALLALVDGT